MSNYWTVEEATAIVNDYFTMLMQELEGIPYSKAEHNRNLQKILNSRSKNSIERKHQNISALLIELGLPYIDGYKPLSHYQRMLKDVVYEYLTEAPQIISSLASLSEAQTIPDQFDISNIQKILVDPPQYKPTELVEDQKEIYSTAKQYNFLEGDIKNQNLGKSGEKFVIEFEKFRLSQAGREDLAKHIEWIAHTQGDGAGYDIASFDEDGIERFIEVKTTKYARSFPFFISRNEVNFSKSNADQYYLYRVFNFSRNARLFMLKGQIEQHCQLIPKVYEVRF